MRDTDDISHTLEAAESSVYQIGLRHEAVLAYVLLEQECCKTQSITKHPFHVNTEFVMVFDGHYKYAKCRLILPQIILDPSSIVPNQPQS